MKVKHFKFTTKFILMLLILILKNYLPSAYPGECPSPALPFPSSAGNTLLQPQNTENQLKKWVVIFVT